MGYGRILGQTSEESPPALLSRSRCAIRLGEIIALEQKRRIQILGQSIGKTVTIVQVRTVTRPLAEVPGSVTCFL